MKKGFIEINGTMHDFEEYMEEVRLIREYVKKEFNEYLKGFDFTYRENKKNLIFYNKRMDIEISVKFSKRKKVKFV